MPTKKELLAFQKHRILPSGTRVVASKEVEDQLDALAATLTKTEIARIYSRKARPLKDLLLKPLDITKLGRPVYPRYSDFLAREDIPMRYRAVYYPEGSSQGARPVAFGDGFSEEDAIAKAVAKLAKNSRYGMFLREIHSGKGTALALEKLETVEVTKDIGEFELNYL